MVGIILPALLKKKLRFGEVNWLEFQFHPVLTSVSLVERMKERPRVSSQAYTRSPFAAQGGRWKDRMGKKLRSAGTEVHSGPAPVRLPRPYGSAPAGLMNMQARGRYLKAPAPRAGPYPAPPDPLLPPVRGSAPFACVHHSVRKRRRHVGQAALQSR